MTDPLFWTFITGIVVSIAGFWGLFGFGRMVPGTIGLTRHLSRACFWSIGAITWRTLYWDVIRPVMMWRGEWMDWYLGTGTSPNLFWNIAYILAIYHAMKAMHLMIPAKDREGRKWWLAPGWPPLIEDRYLLSVLRERLTFGYWIRQLRGRRK